MSDLFIRHAAICKTFSHAKRLEIINLLRGGGELTASGMLERLRASKANLSRHMAVLIQNGIVKSRREGINVYYKLADERIIRACDIMREVLISRLEEEAGTLKRLKKRGPP